MPTPSWPTWRPRGSGPSPSSARAPRPPTGADPGIPAERAEPVAARRFSSLESPVYRRFLLAAMIGTIGGFMQTTTQGWLVLQLTNSPGLLGLAAAAAGVPTLFLAVFAGVLADRLDRRRLLVATNLAGALFAAILAILTSTQNVAYWHVLIIAFASGVALTVQMPANQAVVSTIVDRTAIGNAVALNSAQYNLSRIIAPTAAGILITAGGIAIGFWVNAVALLLVAVLVAGLAIPGPRTLDRVQAAMWRDLEDGVRYVAGQRLLAVLVLLPAVPALFVLNYLTFIPVFARDILSAGPLGLGLRTASIGIGALAGALTLATLRPSGGSGRLMLGGMVLVSIGLVTFATSRVLVLSMVALAVMGAFQVAYYSTTNTLIQVLAPPRLRGRILSLYVLTSIGLIPIANVAGGALADSVGVPAVLAAGGAITLLVALGVAVLEPRILGLRAAAISREAALEA